MKPRAAVVLIQNDKIALIERYRSGKHYLVFPGGKIEAGEIAAFAAKREIKEELGLDVEIGQMVAEVWYEETPQYYFLGHAIGGQFRSWHRKRDEQPCQNRKKVHTFLSGFL